METLRLLWEMYQGIVDFDEATTFRKVLGWWWNLLKWKCLSRWVISFQREQWGTYWRVY